MKILAKIRRSFAVVLSIGLAMVSCNKPDLITYDKEGNIYMPQAAAISNFALLLADTAQAISFGAAYGGLGYPGQDINVTFKIDTNLVTSYNAAHGTAYRVMPAASYQVPSLEATVKAGQTSSNTLPIQVTTSKLSNSVKYMLPVSIASASAGYIDSALQTTYFRIDTISRLEKDITAQATLTVSRENDGGSGAGEGSPKLVDGDYDSKFLTGGFPQDFWIQMTFPSAQVIGAYTITSGNDAEDRDMKNWELVGSNDGATWTPLDTHTDEKFAGRNLTKRYEFTNINAYTQYRINVLENNGSDLIQVSEWRLITFP